VIRIACGLQLRGQLRLGLGAAAFPFHRACARTDARQDVVFRDREMSTACVWVDVKKQSRKILRWLGFVVLAVITLAASGMLLVYFASERAFARQYKVAEILSVPRPVDAAEIAEGQRLARLTGCTHCHGENLAGAVPLDIPNVARFVAPNLTTIVQDYSDAELTGLLRRGVKRDGHGAWFMPSEMFRHLHDQDIARIIAWMRTMPKTAGIEEQTKMRIIGRFIVATEKYRSSAAEIELLEAAGPMRDPPGRGAYLVMNLCSECHGQDLKGRPEAKAPPLDVTKGYSLDAFARLLREGAGPGERTFELMTPTAKARFSSLLPEEIAAMHAFLQARAAP
jgi:cytochrome c553